MHKVRLQEWMSDHEHDVARQRMAENLIVQSIAQEESETPRNAAWLNWKRRLLDNRVPWSGIVCKVSLDRISP